MMDARPLEQSWEDGALHRAALTLLLTLPG